MGGGGGGGGKRAVRGEGEDREQTKREGRGGKRRQGRWGTQAVAPTEAKSRGAAPKRYRRELPPE